jgi:parallel beta-helix repeat protein
VLTCTVTKGRTGPDRIASGDMMPKPALRVLVTATVVGAACVVPLLLAPPAGAQPSTVYVHANANAYDSSCPHAAFTDIQRAVEAAALGGTVVVCPGIYQTSVTIDRRVNLTGRHGAVIDATGQPYGVGVAASYVTVSGLTVKNASPLSDTSLADGIVTAGVTAAGPVAADHVRIIGNLVTGNLGSGIDLNSTKYSVATGNVAIANGVGINVADDLGTPSAHNTIKFNVTNKNFGGCGIALADHTGAGVTDNAISYNLSNDNGLSTATAPDASAGSGIILASPIPGGIVRNNTISYNAFNGNGHGGVVVHSHVPNIPGGPSSDFSGNVIYRNQIGTNNLRTDTSDLKTTGIYLGSASPMTIKVWGNRIGPDYYAIFTAGPVTVTRGSNVYRHVTVHLGSVPTY